MSGALPGRGPKTPEERMADAVRSQPVNSGDGTIQTRQGGQRPPTDPIPSGGVQVVVHGDNGDVPRPPAALVRWVGAATPSNAELYDDWYPATI